MLKYPNVYSRIHVEGTPARSAVCFLARLCSVGTSDLLGYERDYFRLNRLHRDEICCMPRQACARHYIVFFL